MEENNIRMVLDKKNVLMGNKKYDITSQIIEILTSKLKSINLINVSNFFFKKKGLLN